MVEYSILVLTGLASAGKDIKKSAREISRDYNLPLPTVSKILKQLAKNDIVLSIQGAKGGYKLIKASEEINLKMLVEIFDGSSTVVTCLKDDSQKLCNMPEDCPARKTMLGINFEINKMLENITLKKVIQA